MKKLVAVFLTAMMAVSLFTVSYASSKTMTMGDSDPSLTMDVRVEDGVATYWTPNDSYIGFKDVDFTGIKSIRVTATQIESLKGNGEALRVYIDHPVTGKCLGYINIWKHCDEKTEFGLNIEGVTGTHNLYLEQNYNETGSYLKVFDLILSDKVWERPDKVDPVPDEQIVDNWHDTWTAVDAVGRKLADYEETGGVKNGIHQVGMMYWDWHDSTAGSYAVIIPEVIAQYPEAKEDYYHPAWKNAATFWGESVYGFYNCMDYWIYRKNAVLMSDAGVDTIFFDYSNYQNCYVEPMRLLLRAYHDARVTGVDVPKVSAYLQMGWNQDNRFNSLKAMYNNFYGLEDYTDLWFKINGKPMLCQAQKNTLTKAPREGDQSELELARFFLDFFTIRGFGSRANGPKDPYDEDWLWLENYPQYEWCVAEGDVRTEMVNIGMGINESYVYGAAATGVFSDPYNKGKSYTEAFGEDYRPEAVHEGYFFKEQASRVLDVDPCYVYVDGWNEWCTGRSENYNGFANAFVDLFDDENSRDFEPTKGALKDDYYMLLTDFIRKYKGVRPAPVANEAKTIDIHGDLSQWDSVAPEFINDYSDYERDADGYTDSKTHEVLHYTTEVKNSMARAKVSRDAENLYFYVRCEKDIVLGHDGCLVLYINTDRNYATGWEGYDYAVNLAGMGKISRFGDGVWSYDVIGDVDYAVTGNVLTVKIPRALIGETGTTELEFKWTDNINMADGDLVRFYSDGVSAPIGRFNYLYTEIPQTALTAAERSSLSDTTVLKAGSQKMIVDGAKMNVYDGDIRISAFCQDGTLYVPARAVEEFMGYGETKITYDYTMNMLYIKTHELEDRTITDYQWIYTTLGSLDAHYDGEPRALSHPTIAVNGIVYIPISLLAECFGWQIVDLGDGAYAISQRTANADAARGVLSHIQ